MTLGARRTRAERANFLWTIAELLRDAFKRGNRTSHSD